MQSLFFIELGKGCGYEFNIYHIYVYFTDRKEKKKHIGTIFIIFLLVRKLIYKFAHVFYHAKEIK